jgi:DNA (cytosine-5)-methyltransferase 1
MLRAIREIQPSYVVAENVSGIISWNGGVVFNEVQVDLETAGYEVFPFVLPACAVNAPHRRDRVWFIAKNTRSNGCRNGEYDKQGGIGNIGELSTGSEERIFGKEIKSDVTNSNSNGFNRSNSEHEINPSEGRFDALNDVEQVCDVTDTNRNDERLLCGQQPEQSFKTQPIIGNISGEEFTADTGSEQLQERTQNSITENREENRTGMDNRAERSSDIRNVTNTDSRRQSGKEHGQKESGRITETGFSNYWQNFPTQSPLCSGDDGISGRLVGITFPKWRNESIKAMGNAIVPAVAFQIFKAISQCESRPSPTFPHH